MSDQNEHFQSSLSTIWGTFKCEADKLYQWQNGPLVVNLKRCDHDWLIAGKHLPDEETATEWFEASEEIPDLDWKRWPFNEDYPKISIWPAMPDRPLVVKTRIQSNLPPGVKATFYVNIPLWAKISAVAKPEAIEMTRLKMLTLSNTWFGDNFVGELCYALKTRALRDYNDSKLVPYRALCPVVIQNEGKEPLPIQKICIRAKHLNIYEAEDQLWTNSIRVYSKGEGITSRVEYQTAPPNEAKNAKLLQKAEEAPQQNFFSTLGHSFLNIF